MRAVACITIYALAGFVSGLISGLEVVVVHCSPKFAWKAVEGKLVPLLFGFDYAVIGVFLGLIVFFVFRKSRSVGRTTVIAGALGAATALIYGAAALLSPAGQCALP